MRRRRRTRKQGDASAAELDPLLKKFVDVLGVVQSNAAEPASLDKEIYGGAIPSMLRPLDPAHPIPRSGSV